MASAEPEVKRDSGLWSHELLDGMVTQLRDVRFPNTVSFVQIDRNRSNHEDGASSNAC